MTLTSLLPTLRDSIPTPLDAGAWPAHTHATPDDVVMAGVSLLRIVDLCATPCVHTGPAVIAWSGGMASPTESTTVVAATVTAADAGGIRLDAVFHGHAPLWREARLIGRVSHAYERQSAVFGADGTVGIGVVLLPSDVRVGDVIAVPCSGAIGVGDVRPARVR